MSTQVTSGTALDLATVELLTESLREVLDRDGSGRELRAALAELGWADVAATDPATATTLLFTEHGRALATSSALDDVLLAELAPLLPRPTGARAVLYPHPDSGTEPTPVTGPLRGLLLVPPDEVAEVVVPVTAEAGVSLVVFPADSLTGVVAPAGGFDQDSGWSLITASATTTASAGNPLPAATAWAKAVAAGRRALAAEIIGTCEAALDAAVAHTTARVQYGRAIGSFQAVRHRLAEAHVAVSGARATLAAAWAADARPDGGSWAARLAKVRAGAAQVEVMRHAVQVLGAMGITRESDLHRYVARAAALDALLGSHVELTEALGADLLAGAEFDPVIGIDGTT